MNRVLTWHVVIIVCWLLSVSEGFSQQESINRMKSTTFAGLRLRSIGPALMSGRISDIAVDRERPNTWYVAAGSGNLWKTQNAGTTWEPIFENQGSYSIGCVTIDPSNRFTIWVGTGEAVAGRHVGYGDGIYRSLDGGKSFQHMQLKETEHIAKIVVDPRDSQTVYVAAQGPLWSAGGQRGLYKTSDGGNSWTQVLAKGPYTGVTDVLLDPRNPDVVFAVTHQRHRTVAALIDGGPESGIYKSVDAGQTWRQLNRGLPQGDLGKIALAVSAQRPEVMYTSIELSGRKGGFWRSQDGGESWTRRSDYVSGGTGPHYYQEIWVDPHRFDVVYQANVELGRTDDGGRTWTTVESPWKHVDNHAVAFHPRDPEFLLVGCDGGVYRSYDFAETFQYCANLPLTQFYKLSLDNDFPFYNIVGGTQDNNTLYGPSRTGNQAGIRNSDWKTTIGGDGHDCAIDPEDPNVIYCESQQGFLRRYDRRTGTSIDIRPQPAAGEDALRFNWDAPVLISPHSHTRLYFGSKKLHRSDDRGNSWKVISPDLSRNLDRFQLPIMGRVWSIDAVWDLGAMSQFGNITSITESPLREGLIYVGTDDGLVQVTEDGGQTWRKIEKIYGVPEFAFVNDIKADLHDANTVYVVFDHHKRGDFRPLIMCSRDRGQTWSSMTGDLPDRHIVWRLVQDHVKPELFFSGTEFGIFVTIDSGTHWIKLTGGVPTIPFRDLEIQRRENDLVGASFGRGFFVFDDFSALRVVDDRCLAEEECIVFPVKETLRYVPSRVFGRTKGSQGDSFFTASNPSFGAVFTYYLRDGLQSLKALRTDQEVKIKKAGGDNPRPDFERLKEEEREEQPTLLFTITNDRGEVLRKIRGPVGSGFHRINWDLRSSSLTGGGQGPLVPPGTYRVCATKRVRDEETPIGDPREFRVVSVIEGAIPDQKPADVRDFQQQAGELRRVVVGASRRLVAALSEVVELKNAVRNSSRGTVEMLNMVRKLQLALLDARDQLSGDTTRSQRNQTRPPSIEERASVAYFGSLQSTQGPTQTHRQQYEIASDGYRQIRKRLKKLIDRDLEKLKRTMDQAGIPWTSGRKVPALPE